MRLDVVLVDAPIGTVQCRFKQHQMVLIGYQWHSTWLLFEIPPETFGNCPGFESRTISPSGSVHCPRNNMNRRIKTEPVLAGADATVYRMSCFCLYIYISGQETRPLLQPWQARFVCGNSDCFWDSAPDCRQLSWVRNTVESQNYKWQNRKLRFIYRLHIKVALPRWRMS